MKDCITYRIDVVVSR